VLPTLIGRIQTRLFLLAVVGGLVTLVITPVLPIDASIAEKYHVTYVVLITVAVLGVGWECVYQFLMQFRWEKDWPTLFGLVTLVPEGLLVWGLLLAGWIPTIDGPVSSLAFWIDFILVWLAVWLVANGPMRVPFIRWRFRGGRLL
jgi:hypothetical protein